MKTHFNFERKVWTVNGAITSHIRKRLGVEKIRDNDIHHAVDATIIAITTQGMINRITKYYQYNDGKFMNSKGEYIDFETVTDYSCSEIEERLKLVLIQCLYHAKYNTHLPWRCRR